MKKSDKIMIVAVGATLVLVAFGAVAGGGSTGKTSSNSETTVTTNENGSVSRTFTEATVTTNGNMVTEYRRETRTTMDMEGNVLATSTSEYAQSYPVGDSGMTTLAASAKTSVRSGAAKGEEPPTKDVDSFMGLKFGDVFAATNFVSDAAEPDFLRTTFTPKKPLAGFDDFYVYVTPKTHKIARVYACAKQAVEPVTRWRRHYLIEALEKRYGTWARLCSWHRPFYAFDVGAGKHITACLDGATPDYRTVIAAWDDEMGGLAAEESEALREEARKTAAEKRSLRVSAAEDAF